MPVTAHADFDDDGYRKIYTEAEIAEMKRRFRELLKIFRGYHSQENPAKILDAWFAAVRAHSKLSTTENKIRRKSGEPYLYHVLAVGTILAEWGLDATAVAAGILHDCAEDTEVGLKEIRSGAKHLVAKIVQGVTKFKDGRSSSKEDGATIYIRNLIQATQKEIRVPIVKLADRLHNMRTLAHMPPEKQSRIARETLEIYCPLAHTLGMAKVCRELENLAYSYIDPGRYKAVRGMLDMNMPRLIKQSKNISDEIKLEMSKLNIDGDIHARVKEVYSIHERLEQKQWSLDELGRIKNLIKIIVVCQDPDDCYRLLAGIRQKWTRYQLSRDGISVPRRNQFSALLEWRTVSCGLPFEVQICSEEMFRVNEYGVTANWRYSQWQEVSVNDEPSLSWLGECFKWLLEIENAAEFRSAFASELNKREIYVIAEKLDKEIKEQRLYLPIKSTPIDVAYQINSHLGHEADSCLVNGEEFPLTSSLSNGDRVRIVSVKNNRPKKEWKDFARTSRARIAIQSWLNKADPDKHKNAPEKGYNRLLTVSRHYKVNIPEKDKLPLELAYHFNCESLDDLYRDVYFGKTSPVTVLVKILEINTSKNNVPNPPADASGLS